MIITGIIKVLTSFTKDMINMSTYLWVICFIHSAIAHTFFGINNTVYIVITFLLEFTQQIREVYVGKCSTNERNAVSINIIS